MALTFSAVIISVHGLFPLIGYRKSELCVVKDIVTLFCLHPLSRVASLFNSIYLNANTDETKSQNQPQQPATLETNVLYSTLYIVHSSTSMKTLTGWVNFASGTIQWRYTAVDGFSSSLTFLVMLALLKCITVSVSSTRQRLHQRCVGGQMACNVPNNK